MTDQDEIAELLDKHRQLYKDYEQQVKALSERFMGVLGDQGTPQSFMDKCQKFKQKNPQAFEQIKQSVEKKMSSFIANQRYKDQKPLNRKGTRNRKWV